MNLQSAKKKLISNSIFFSEENIYGKPSVIGYEKKFKMAWMATQLNTFIVISDFGEDGVNAALVEQHLAESFEYAKKNYNGWPRGLQSGMGVISIIISSNVNEDAKEYCRKLKSDKKWAGFTIPVTIDVSTNQIFRFEKTPMWGGIYFPHIKKLIDEITSE